MRKKLDRVLAALERHYGAPEMGAASDPYVMLVFANCGYPASEAACTKGFDALEKLVGSEPAKILRAPQKKLVEAMRAGGIVPELRAERLREIAGRVVAEYGGDLRSALVGPIAPAMKILKSFPTIADAGAEKILLFARLAPVLAVPSNATQVPLRLGWGDEGKSWAAGYKSAQRALAAELTESFEPRMRAYLLFKQHGETTCKRSTPNCPVCPAAGDCAYYASSARSNSPKR
jgi:endonuclease III